MWNSPGKEKLGRMVKIMAKGEVWNAIEKQKGLKDLPNAAITFNNRIMTRLVEFAISDLGPPRIFSWKELQLSTPGRQKTQLQ